MFRCCVSGPFTSDKWNRVRAVIGVVAAVLCVIGIGLFVHYFTKSSVEEEEVKDGTRLCFTCASCVGMNCSSLGQPLDSACKSAPRYLTTCLKEESCYRVEAKGKGYAYFMRKCSKCEDEKKQGCRSTIYKRVNTTYCYCNTDRCLA